MKIRKVIIFGNSGSGKSTIAKELSEKGNLAHLDLDTLAWLPSSPPSRTPLAVASVEVQAFISANTNWVIEGCYTDLLELASSDANEAIFMDVSVKQCIENARNRPWEPHKYDSKQSQDSNLEMLVLWIQDYEKREGVFSYNAHSQLFENFSSIKTKYINNQRDTVQ